jgi:hypothetical protein
MRSGGPNKPGETENGWKTSASGVGRLSYSIRQRHKYYKESTESLLVISIISLKINGKDMKCIYTS